MSDCEEQAPVREGHRAGGLTCSSHAKHPLFLEQDVRYVFKCASQLSFLGHYTMLKMCRLHGHYLEGNSCITPNIYLKARKMHAEV